MRSIDLTAFEHTFLFWMQLIAINRVDSIRTQTFILDDRFDSTSKYIKTPHTNWAGVLMAFLCPKGCDVDSVWRVFEMERNQYSPVCWKHSWSVQMQHAPDTTLTVSLCLFEFLKWNGYVQNAVLICYTYYTCTTVCILCPLSKFSVWMKYPDDPIYQNVALKKCYWICLL